MTKSADPTSKRSQRRANRKFTGSRAQRRNARRLAWGSVACNHAGTGPQELTFEGTERRSTVPQSGMLLYKRGANDYHA